MAAFEHGLNNFDVMKGEAHNVGLSDAKIHLFRYPIGENPDKRDYIVSNEKVEATGHKPNPS